MKQIIIASVIFIATSSVGGKRLALDRILDGKLDRVGDGLHMGYMHPMDRWAENKIDQIFKGDFNTIPRGDSEWTSSGPEAFHVEGGVPSVKY